MMRCKYSVFILPTFLCGSRLREVLNNFLADLSVRLDTLLTDTIIIL